MEWSTTDRKKQEEYLNRGKTPSLIPNQGFELQVGGTEGIDNADVPVRWCVTPELVSQIEQKGYVDPHVVIATVQVYDQPHRNLAEISPDMDRQVVPIADLMTYVRFTKPGTCRVFGWIVDGSRGRKYLHQYFKDKSHGEYTVNLLDQYDGDFRINHKHFNFNVVALSKKDILIPDDVFGAEPPGWIKWLANLWVEERTQDECHFRRRVIFGLTIKWIPVVLVGLLIVGFRVIVNSILTLGGWPQKAIWKYSFRPYKYVNDMAIDDVDFGRLWFWKENKFIWSRLRKKHDSGYESRQYHVGFLPLTPIVVLLVLGFAVLIQPTFAFAAIVTLKVVAFFAVIFTVVDIMLEIIVTVSDLDEDNPITQLGNHIGNHSKLYQWISVLLLLSAVGFSFYTAGYMLIVLLLGAAVAIGLLLAAVMFMIETIFGIGEYDPTKNDPTLIRELLCPKDELNIVADYNSIPKEQRSAKLWFMKMKNSVCRPMQL